MRGGGHGTLSSQQSSQHSSQVDYTATAVWRPARTARTACCWFDLGWFGVVLGLFVCLRRSSAAPGGAGGGAVVGPNRHDMGILEKSMLET